MKSSVQLPTVAPPAGFPLWTWLGRFARETRTRILLLYVATMLLVVAASIPVFRFLLFAEVNERVQEDLLEEIEEFQEDYAAWESTGPNTAESLRAFLDDFLEETLPEDDNFHLAIVDGEFYRAKPELLPEVLSADSELMERWLTMTTSTQAVVPVPDPTVGSVLYKSQVLTIDGTPVGLFVVSHLSAGERAEAWDSVYLFAKMAAGVVTISLLLAWLGSKQLLKPVQQLAKTAKEINETNLSSRLDVPGSGELSELANVFNTMMNRVQTAFTSQRNFINDAGHELRTPLTIIQGHLELMGDDPDEQAETMDIVMDELGRMGRIVNDIVLLAKADRADFLQLETIDLKAFAESIFDKAKALGDRNWQLTNGSNTKFVGDRQRLTGALINLAHNAVQHTQPTDTIELGAAVTHKTVRFWVRDTGTGIAPADQTQIFDRFARIANHYRRSDGAGLGLAIVKAIADAHQGHIELTSQPGVGSTFSLSLPLQ